MDGIRRRPDERHRELSRSIGPLPCVAGCECRTVRPAVERHRGHPGVAGRHHSQGVGLQEQRIVRTVPYTRPVAGYFRSTSCSGSVRPEIQLIHTRDRPKRPFFAEESAFRRERRCSINLTSPHTFTLRKPPDCSGFSGLFCVHCYRWVDSRFASREFSRAVVRGD